MPFFSGAALNKKFITVMYTDAKIVTRNFLPWEHGLHLIKTIGYTSITTVNYTTENAMGTPNDKASKTINYVSLVRNNYSTKKYGTTFLVKEEHVMPCANT
ncbi:hypothetical protein G9A89_004984 [Geosiphon pyriformis]|nr:hypothetical protein G9A89_004984 [Geosiphon pyriformis]